MLKKHITEKNIVQQRHKLKINKCHANNFKFLLILKTNERTCLKTAAISKLDYSSNIDSIAANIAASFLQLIRILTYLYVSNERDL